MLMRQVGFAFLLLILSGCATTTWVVSNYNVGDTVQATVGRPLIEIDGYYSGSALMGGTAAFERQLIYGGKGGDTIRMTYREPRVAGQWCIDGSLSPGSLALCSPPFSQSQDLQYDLSQSKVIAFQEMRLEVLDATSDQITAKVLPPVRTASDTMILEPRAKPTPQPPAPTPEQGTQGFVN